MPNLALVNCELWSSVTDGSVWTIPEDELVRQIYTAFKSETERLKGAFAVERNTPPRLDLYGRHSPRTPSEILFGENFDEVNRTYLGILALRWTWTNDYDRFTRGQTENVKLKDTSFQWLRQYFQDNLKTPMDVLSIILAMVVNDLGKDPALATNVLEETGKNLSGSNHDTILLEAARHGMVPSLDYLDDSHREDIMLGLELGSELNAGQLAQAENVPVNLEGLLVMQGNERAFNLKFIEQILDVAGAAGHVFADGVKNLIEPVFQAFKTVHEVSLCIIRRECTLREGYDQVLAKRAKLLEDEGFRPLDVENREERALLRLLTMGRAATLEQAKLFDAAFKDLTSNYKEMLVEGLNIDAIEDNETAVIPYYMPAMIAETIRNTRDSHNEKEALTALMRYLARVLRWNDDETAEVPLPANTKENHAATWPILMPVPILQFERATSPFQQKEGRVYERNMIRARDTISSPNFRANPNMLDDLPPPVAHLLSRRRTSYSV